MCRCELAIATGGRTRTRGRALTEPNPTRDWDYLAVSNIIPVLPSLIVEDACGLCHTAMRVDLRGGLYTGPARPAPVCDTCGARQAPDLMTLVHRLRACGAVTVTIGGARIDEDAKAWCCPLCDHEHAESPPNGWHLVDAVHGRPVCSSCAATLPDEADLLAALREHELRNDLWFSHRSCQAC